MSLGEREIYRMQKTLSGWGIRVLQLVISVGALAVPVFLLGAGMRLLWEVLHYAWTWGGLL